MLIKSGLKAIGLLSFIVILLCSCKSSEEKQASSDKPNILFIMADDHTTQAISAYGGIFAKYANTLLEAPRVELLSFCFISLKFKCDKSNFINF